MLSPKSSHFLPAALCALALATPLVAHAQPDPNNAPKAENPDNRPVRPNNRREPMTPEQREAAIGRYMKSQIERAGITDETQQDVVIEYIQNEMDARQDLQESSRTLGTALRNKTLTDAQVAGLLNTYMGEVEDDKARRAAAQKKLSETVDMPKAPRLEAMLVLMGAWGDAPNMGGNMLAGRGRNRDDQRNDNATKPAKKEPKAKAAGA